MQIFLFLCIWNVMLMMMMMLRRWEELVQWNGAEFLVYKFFQKSCGVSIEKSIW